MIEVKKGTNDSEEFNSLMRETISTINQKKTQTIREKSIKKYFES